MKIYVKEKEDFIANKGFTIKPAHILEGKLKDNEIISSVWFKFKDKDLEILEMYILILLSEQYKNEKYATKEVFVDMEKRLKNFNPYQVDKLDVIIGEKEKLDIKTIDDVHRIIKNIDNYLLVENVKCESDLGKEIVQKIDRFKCKNKELLGNIMYDKIADTYTEEHGIEIIYTGLGSLINIENIKDNELIKKFIKEQETKTIEKIEEFE